MFCKLPFRVMIRIEVGDPLERPTHTEVARMVAAVTKRDGDSITVSVTVRLDGPMLESEEAIQDALNEAGMLLEQENLERFDTDGSPIQVGPVAKAARHRSTRRPTGRSRSNVTCIRLRKAGEHTVRWKTTPG